VATDGCYVSGELRFSWLRYDGALINWWSSDLARDVKRFVHNEWGQFAVAVDLRGQEAQILFNQPSERHVIRFAEIADENSRLAVEAACEAREGAFTAELLMRVIGRDDMADMMTARMAR
jgi:hypothetical protein